LNQVHGDTVVDAANSGERPCADASFTDQPRVVCAVLTADCLPVLFCDSGGTRVAAAHAGWRGLAAGVLESAVRALNTEPGRLMAWLGPAIGPGAFEVGGEVRQVFVEQHAEAAGAFLPRPQGRWLADLYQLARIRLLASGVTAVYGGGYCTVTDRQRFYSYRRDGVTGRMASLIWLV
jgi:YfiH family protein